MNNMYPGIFIPLTTETNYFENGANFNLFSKPSCQLTFNLDKQQIHNEVCQSWRISGKAEKQIEHGLLVFLEHPHQMEYQKALHVINDTFEIQQDELTIPMGNVPAAGLGIATKSVYVDIEVEFKAGYLFYQHLDKICKMLQQPFLGDAKLILSAGTSGFEIHGTSPVVYGANHAAWQQHLGKVLRKAGYNPLFFQTWSTNKAISDFLKNKSQERQQKEELAYIEKIKVHNQRLQ